MPCRAPTFRLSGRRISRACTRRRLLRGDKMVSRICQNISRLVKIITDRRQCLTPPMKPDVSMFIFDFAYLHRIVPGVLTAGANTGSVRGQIPGVLSPVSGPDQGGRTQVVPLQPVSSLPLPTTYQPKRGRGPSQLPLLATPTYWYDTSSLKRSLRLEVYPNPNAR